MQRIENAKVVFVSKVEEHLFTDAKPTEVSIFVRFSNSCQSKIKSFFLLSLLEQKGEKCQSDRECDFNKGLKCIFEFKVPLPIGKILRVKKCQPLRKFQNSRENAFVVLWLLVRRKIRRKMSREQRVSKTSDLFTKQIQISIEFLSFATYAEAFC